MESPRVGRTATAPPQPERKVKPPVPYRGRDGGVAKTPSWKELSQLNGWGNAARNRKGRVGKLVDEQIIYMNQSNRIVTRVRDSVTNRTFVLKKVITPCDARLSAEDCLKLGAKDLHEVKCMVDLEHPNTVAVYEAWLDLEVPEKHSQWLVKWLDIQKRSGTQGQYTVCLLVGEGGNEFSLIRLMGN